jgi:hypothetical protein
LVRTVVALAATAALLSACSGDDAGQTKNTESSATSTTPSSAFTGDGAVSRAEAERALLTVSDFPEGWQELPEDSTGSPYEDSLLSCLGVDIPGLLDPSNEAHSVFSFDTGLRFASSNAMVLASVKDAETWYEALASDMFERCSRQEAQANSAEFAEQGERLGYSFGEPEFRESSFGPIGDESFSVGTAIVRTGPDGKATLTTDTLFFRSANVVYTVSHSNTGAAISTALAERLRSAMASRLPKH